MQYLASGKGMEHLGVASKPIDVVRGAVGVAVTSVRPVARSTRWLPEVTAEVLAFVLALVIVSFLHLVVGEMAPKSWAIAHPETIRDPARPCRCARSLPSPDPCW